MATGKFVAYYRVSTQKQGASGLGLQAQRSAVSSYLEGGNSELISEFTEVETGKGANALEKRPELKAALDACRRHGAKLVIAKLDRLARNVHFVSGLIETGVDFVAADMPDANKVMIQMHAVMSEWERDQISARTKAALTAAKVRGVKLGSKGAENLQPNIKERQKAACVFARKIAPVLEGFRQQGLSQRKMLQTLNDMSIPARNGGNWTLIQLQRVLRLIESFS